ncbi:PAP2 superfamily-domain-containing protein [Xylaria sp. FL0043]|nr:PAP2 superfamily-domain-containing protein [Xylaria sp. FL0043]
MALLGSSIILAASYAFDWALLVVLAVVGYVVNNLTPNHHAFSLVDPSISYPLHADTVSIGVAAIVAGVAPVVIILIVILIFVPGPTVPKGTPHSLVWKRRLWELHASWLGLATSLAAAWFLTNGLKQLFGKPRPNMLARCQPDLSNIAAYVVGGVLTAVSDGRLVTSAICKNLDKAVVDEGFRSFPSGHTTISAAGLVYLTLLLASKLSAGIPFLHPRMFTEDEAHVSAFPSRRNYQNISSPIPLQTRRASQPQSSGTGYDQMLQGENIIAARSQAAAPPLYLIIITLLPVGAAVFISTSRWYDFQHHGFDILVSFIFGTLFAIFSFRYYHLPIGRGAGWAWGPRSRSRAFFAGIGNASYTAHSLDTNEALV